MVAKDYALIAEILRDYGRIEINLIAAHAFKRLVDDFARRLGAADEAGEFHRGEFLFAAGVLPPVGGEQQLVDEIPGGVKIYAYKLLAENVKLFDEDADDEPA